ncbi:hypothetical protein MYCTH_2310947 [Thermothelomyces thermophilus ATCC 42464]|uniref:Zn(2)-C6 fungal-type domain-containing protein n=1 Tax=Thermothelomyces thermophilus (strain ATCC 42464 / BCRC 31852 / DSM 1799) TaxID=573729 RepID=G2QMA9_THET4|nr:uncharacterized protein MYCTH_2310947 [Thermothelomyces thermophilus ATCC 42464]AEO61089.1 hypothetical protein MYCTH_2310947 [Thermothelomyces thermophilus ATCC 42464]
MARHGSVGAFNGFSVCQPALGAALQWLPAIGTPELDEMINALLPGPASIQDKRAHISMDFFEYSRQTGETFKFYPVPLGTFTPVTASPATSTLHDSGYASSFNHSPALSEQGGSWTQSPAPFAPAVFDAKTKPRSSASKKSSASSSRQQKIDFANHPGMRILTKDGRDVTNSASRGCKTKEQRDHAHLMRIIKACDSCKRKKVRCDPSHRKRNASQASTVQPEQKPAKRVKKAEEPNQAAALDPPIDLTAAEPLTAENLPFPTVDLGFPPESEDFWNEFITLDQEPVAAAPVPALDDFIFDSFTDFQSFLSPSSGSSATSPSQVLTPVTPERAVASPIVAPDHSIKVSGEASPQDPAVPYLNPGVALGTNYLDFNLYSPGPDAYDEDPVLQMRDLGSQQHSPQSTASAADNFLDHNAPSVSATHVDVSAQSQTSASQPYGAAGHATVSPLDLARYYDPGDTRHHDPQPSTPRVSTNRKTMTNHSRLLQEPVVDHGCYRRVDANESGVIAATSAQSPVAHASSPAVLSSYASAVAANAPQPSVSPSRDPRSRVICVSAPCGGSHSSVRSRAPTKATQSDVLVSGAYAKSSAPIATRHGGSPLCSTEAAFSAAAGVPSQHTSAGVAVRAVMPSGARCSASSQRLAGRQPGLSAVLDGQHVTQQQDAVAVINAVRATMLLSTLPTRCNVAGKDVTVTTSCFQLAVFGLVSFLCACALQAHLARQVSLVNILAITTLSLARLAPRCSGLPGAARAASNTLPPPAQPGVVDNFLSMIQPVVTGSSKDQRSALSRWARGILPRPPLVRTLRV